MLHVVVFLIQYISVVTTQHCFTVFLIIVLPCNDFSTILFFKVEFFFL